MDAVRKGPPDPLVSVALSRRPSFYRRDGQDCALFTFAQFVEISWPDGGRSPACVSGLIRKVEGLRWSKLPNLPVTLTISLLPWKADAVHWGKTLVFQREDKRGMT
jgi:hypothetical protein